MSRDNLVESLRNDLSVQRDLSLEILSTVPETAISEALRISQWTTLSACAFSAIRDWPINYLAEWS